MSPAAPALEQALAARQSPGLFRRFRERPLPGDVALLLRIAANETEACEQACAISGEPRWVVVEAAVLYIQQVMFHPESDSYRVFGVDADALEAEIREHRRWLLRWLHPDRNSDAWNGVYVSRVTLAWQDLRSIERRADYDSRRPTRTHGDPAGRQALVLRQDQRLGRYDDEVLLSARATRRLPIVVLGTLAIGSISMLGLEFYLKNMDAAGPLAVEFAVPPPPAIGRLETVEAVEPPEPVGPIEAVPRIVATPSAGPAAAPVVMAARSALPTPAAHKPPTQPVAPATPAAPAPLITKSAPVSSMAMVAPAKSQPPETRAASSPPIVIDDMLIAELVTKFRRAYASGKLEQVRALLSEQAPDAQGEQKLILDAYKRLFESSRNRGMELRNVSWFAQGDIAVLIARYEAWVELRGERKRRRETGDIRFDLRREGGILRISRLRHSAQGG